MARQNGKGVQINLNPTGDVPYFTFARAVEGPTPESFNMGGRVTVNGRDTYIEVKPQADWFEIRTMRGVKKVYLKLQVTGLEPIYYGPYDTKEESLLALHRILNAAYEALIN